MTTSSRNAAVRNMALRDGEEETKTYIREHFGIPSNVKSWQDIDDHAERIQRERNKQYKEENK